jgi:1,4-alpha-glucan branching enzyme
MAATTPIRRRSSRDEGSAPADLERLLALRHPDPHSILGPHPGPRGTTVRAFQPEAEQVRLIAPGGKPLPMNRRNEAGLFEVTVRGQRPGFAYRFEVQFHDGSRIEEEDPYRFAPTLSDLDLYLLGEQTLERPYEKLGANLHEIDGVAGVAFAVWAPNAEGVSVVGEFNHWDGRMHQMRTPDAAL